MKNQDISAPVSAPADGQHPAGGGTVLRGTNRRERTADCRTNEERNLATYLGLALTAVVTYLLQDVPKMLVGRHFGWKLVRYEAFGRVYQADGTGAFVRVPVPAQSRLRYQPYLLPPEDASRHDVTLYTLCPLLYGGALAVVFGRADPADAGAAGVTGAVRTGDGRRGAGDDVHSADG